MQEHTAALTACLGPRFLCRAAYQQARLLGFFYLLTYSILKDKEPKFLTMEAPPPRFEEVDAEAVQA